MKLSDKTVLFYNKGGAHTYLAMRLAEDFKRVMVYTPAKDKLYPDATDHYIGYGLPGLEVIHSFEDHKDEADLFVFPFSGDGDLQARLRAEGKRVFGSGTVETLEQDRVLFKKTLTARGLPVAPHRIVTGIEALRKLSRDDPGWWVKIFGEDSTYRGLCETFFLDAYPKSVNKLDLLSVKLGFLRDVWQFMCEKPLPGFETGNDRFFSGGEVLQKGTWGFELKNLAYICKCEDVNKFPKLIRQVNDALAPVWRKHELCGALSDEDRIVKGKPYCVDLTPRFGSPPGEIMSRLYKNISAIIWACAGGEMVVPEPVAKYAACVNVKSPECLKATSIPLDVKAKDFDKVLLKAACILDGQLHNISMDDDDEVATVIGFGDVLEEAQQQVLENAEKIDGPGVWYPSDCFDETDEILEKAEEAGLERF